LKPLPSNWETILSTYGLDQLVHDPTRVTSKSVTLIDHIYTSRPEEVVQVRVSTYCPGGHYPVKYGKSNKSKPRVNKHTVIRYRNLKNFDEKLFLRDLKNQNFNLVLQIFDPDLALDSWYHKFIYTLNKHAPLISKRVRKNKQPKWHKKEFVDLRQQRDYYHGIKDTENLKKYRNKLTSPSIVIHFI
jgi:hypothetical protein